MTVDGHSGRTAPPSDDARVDELRQRLRALGYLDAGVDRFVLGPARASRRPWTIALFASIRVGALAALLLGPAAAIGVRARMPSLVAGPRDAIVVAVYLGLFFGLAVAASAFVAGALVSLAARQSDASFAKRGDRLSRIAGVAVTLACLTYFTLWWQTVVANVGWSAPYWTISALAIAVAIGLLLGHAVTIMSSAIIVAAVGNVARVPSMSWRTTIAAGLVAFGGAALLLTWSARAAPIDAPRLTVVPSGVRVRVIAIDGFDPAIFQDLADHGRMPALSSAFTQGAVVRIDEDRDRQDDPARVWTTVATGQPAEVHGVRGIETRRIVGVSGSVPAAEESPIARAIRGTTDLVRLTRPAIASGIERRAKTFWEVASDAGLRTAVVNWWATWPARSDGAVVLSDRATLRLEHGGALDAEIAPSSLYQTLRERWPALKQQAVEMAGPLPSVISGDDRRALLRRSAELDAMQLTLASAVSTANTDLTAVYLPGLDITQYALLGSSTTPLDALAASDLAGRLAALREYYAMLDRMLAPSLAPAAGEIVIVVTEPGRVSARTGARMALLGANVSRGTIGDSDSTSVAPTILHVLGVPISRELPGRARLDLFDGEFARRYPVRFVSTYGEPSRSNAVSEGTPLDREMIDRLRSLGYVR
jgi:hypothetical protein